MSIPFDSDLDVDTTDSYTRRISIDKTESSQKLPIKEPILDSALPIGEERVYVSLNSNLRSFKCKDAKFTNFIQKIDSPYQECNALRKIFSCSNKYLKKKDVPFNLDEEMLRKYPRQRKILDASGLSNTVLDNEISKATYRDEVTKGLYHGYKSNQLIRIYFVDQQNSDSLREIEIIIIDLYHLFATINTDKYDEVKSYNTCMTKLMNC